MGVANHLVACCPPSSYTALDQRWGIARPAAAARSATASSNGMERVRTMKSMAFPSAPHPKQWNPPSYA